MIAKLIMLFIVFFSNTLDAAQPLDRSLQAPINMKVTAPPNDGGTHLTISWEMPKKWSFYILDGDKEIGIVESDQRELIQLIFYLE